LKPKLCITSPWNYPLFNPDNQTHFGGWEVRVALLARELARRGNFQVNLVVGDHGQPHVEQFNGVNLYSWVGREIWGISSPENSKPRNNQLAQWFDQYIPFSSRNKPQAMLSGQIGSYLITPGMIEIYDEVDADIYMVPGNSQFSGEAVFFTRQRGKKYIFLAGSDMDFYPEYKQSPDNLDIYSVPYALKTYAIENADALILQNEDQIEMLQKGYNRTGFLVRNPMDLTLAFSRYNEARTILWVGKSDERVKRPSLVFELARKLPEYQFVVIMNLALPETHAQCLSQAKALSNVTLIERVPFEEVERYFAAARLFMNTSSFEGFPNTFLQAAKYGVPIIALDVDPGGMLSRYNCGITCGGAFERFVESVQRLMTDNDLYAKIGTACLNYVRTYHDANIVIEQYENVFREVLAS